MKKRMKSKRPARQLSLESLDPRLCLAAGLVSAGVGEMHGESAGAHVSHWHNASRPHDVNQDQRVTPLDALTIVNTLNVRGARTLSAAEGETNGMVDVDDDSHVTPADCLAVVNELNHDADGGAADSSAEDTSTDVVTSVDEGGVNDGSISDDESATEDGVPADDGTASDLPEGLPGCGDSERPSLSDLFAEADANEDGVLTQDEVPERFWERFSAADTDGSGGISLEELTAFRPECGSQVHPGPEHGGRGAGAPRGAGDPLARFDENEDGLLTSDEVPTQVWEHLAAADTDGDGAVSSAELAAYRPAIPATPSREDLFARLDTDGSGLLTEEELGADVWARLAAGDSDGDGSITPEELLAFKPAPGQGHDRGPAGNCGGDLFARLDQDQDGFLVETEVPAELWERVSAADTDDDDKISSEELAAYRPAPPARDTVASTGVASPSRQGGSNQRSPASHRGGMRAR